MKEITLTENQWVEVHYALEYKLRSPAVKDDAVWHTELSTIMRLISAKVTV